MQRSTPELQTLERVAANDRHADYCLWDYAPAAPASGKLRSSNLLWRALEASGQGERMRAACEALRRGLGPFQTVYGVKKSSHRISFEFYFYDYARLERRVSITRVLEILSPFVACHLKILEGRPYFMFSIDLDEALVSGARQLEGINVYVGNPGSNVSSGICHELTATGMQLRNFYFFFDARKEMSDVVAKIACSAHHDLRGLPMQSILPPELVDCGVIVVANKRFNDGVYFSRLRVDPFIGFLEREAFPNHLVAFARQHRDDLDHMLYDIGVDYVVENGVMRIVKSAFYGLL